MTKFKVSDLLAEGRTSAVSPVDGMQAAYLGHWLEEGDCMTQYEHLVIVLPSKGEAIIVELHTGWSYSVGVYPASQTEEVGGESSVDGSGYDQVSRSFYRWLPDGVFDTPTPGGVFTIARLYWGGQKKEFPHLLRLKAATHELEKNLEWNEK